MGLRFWRRVRLMPGVTLNLSKRGLSSVSLGTRGAHWTLSRGGRRRVTVGLPGTGLFYTASEKPRARPPANAGRSPLWILVAIAVLIIIAVALSR